MVGRLVKKFNIFFTSHILLILLIFWYQGRDNKDKKEIIFFQFPEQLPLDCVSVGSSSVKEDASNKHLGLKDLPNGRLGKMLVYKSGAIKLKLGDTIFDVSFSYQIKCLFAKLHWWMMSCVCTPRYRFHLVHLVRLIDLLQWWILNPRIVVCSGKSTS